MKMNQDLFLFRESGVTSSEVNLHFRGVCFFPNYPASCGSVANLIPSMNLWILLEGEGPFAIRPNELIS